MIALALLLLLVCVAALAAWLAVARGALIVQHRELQLRLEESTEHRNRLEQEVSQLRTLDAQRVAGEAVLDEKIQELERARRRGARASGCESGCPAS